MPFKKGETPIGAKVFQPGQSGNPKGREVGTKTRATVAKKWLETVTDWKNPITGEFEKLTLEDQITLAQIKAAREAETPQAYKVIMDSRYGFPKQEIEHSGEVEIGFDIGKISDDDLQTILQITQKAKIGN
jgi:hypothetical protein